MIVIIEKKKVFNWDIRKLMLLIVNINFYIERVNFYYVWKIILEIDFN